MVEPLCFIGSGTGALLCTRPLMEKDWILKHYNLTAPSNLEMVKSGMFGKIPSVQDFICEWLGQYSSSRNESHHIVVDDHIVTAQNQASTVIAIQTFILLSSQS